MYVLDVVPFSRGNTGGSLSYRSKTYAPPGSIVTVPLRRRKVPAVVVGVEEALDAKASLKAASFALRGSVSEPAGRIPDNLFKAVVKTALWHAAPLGAVLMQLLFPWVDDEHGFADAPGPGFLVRPVECPLTERKARYRTLINSTNGRATLLVVSTLAEVAYWKRAFADLSPLVLTGALTEEKRAPVIKEARAAPLVIVTPHFAFAQMEELDTIIVERVSAGGFRLLKRPYLDLRIALLELARARSLRLVYGDYPLPLEYRAGARKLSSKETGLEVLDVRAERGEGEVWQAVPTSLRERIGKELLQGGRVAVCAARKGYAPVVVCRDCGEALRDERGKVYAFTLERGSRLFRTADGTRMLSTDRNCPNCGSWNLTPLGVGVERVHEELTRAFPKAPVVLFDADTVRTETGARRKLAPMKEAGSIIVGTEAMVPWLFAASAGPFTLALVASADSLLALPFWRARERFLRLGFLLASLAPRTLLATRVPDDAAVRLLKDPTDAKFFEEESALRKALAYPPYGTLISLTWQGSGEVLDRTEKVVREAVEPYPIRIIPDQTLHGVVKKRSMVLSLPENAWPNDVLSRNLSALPPSVRVMVDPESFW